MTKRLYLAVAILIAGALFLWWQQQPSFGDNCAPGDWHWVYDSSGRWACEEGDF